MSFQNAQRTGCAKSGSLPGADASNWIRWGGFRHPQQFASGRHVESRQLLLDAVLQCHHVGPDRLHRDHHLLPPALPRQTGPRQPHAARPARPHPGRGLRHHHHLLLPVPVHAVPRVLHHPPHRQLRALRGARHGGHALGRRGHRPRAGHDGGRPGRDYQCVWRGVVRGADPAVRDRMDVCRVLFPGHPESICKGQGSRAAGAALSGRPLIVRGEADLLEMFLLFR